MRKKDNFNKKYPLFATYITNELVRSNMLDNADLGRKYQAYQDTIKSFIFELEKRFDHETVTSLIIEVIIKLPDEIMVSLITAYLNSDEAAKNNADFFIYYNKTSNFGREAVKYLEENGIVTNRTYKDIPTKIIEEKYAALKKGTESFKGVKLDTIFDYLTYPQKRFILCLMEDGTIDKLDEIFERLNFNYVTLIDNLMKHDIDNQILNMEVYNGINGYYLMVLVCLLIDQGDNARSVEAIKGICVAKRYNLLVTIINLNLIACLANIKYAEIEDKSDDEIIKMLESKELVLKKEEN